MITMKTGSKAPVRFVFSDDVSETTITIAPDDASDTIAAKLQRVLELEGLAGPQAQPVTLSTSFTPAERAAVDERLKGVQRSMGWDEDLDIDDLPEA